MPYAGLPDGAVLIDAASPPRPSTVSQSTPVYQGLPEGAQLIDTPPAQSQIDAKTGKPYIEVTAPLRGQAKKAASPFGNSTAEQMDKAGHTWNLEELKGAIKDNATKLAEAGKGMVRPVLEGGGAVLGGIIGAGGGGVAGLAGGPAAPGTVPYGAIAGGVAGTGLGYAMGSRVADLLEGKQQSLADSSLQSLKDVGTGAMLDMGGQAVVPAAKLLARGVGAIAKPVLGRLSGTGTAAVDEALQSGADGLTANPFKSKTDFDRALRGEVTGEDIVSNAKDALEAIKSQRATTYRSQLANVAKNTAPIDLRPLKSDLSDLMSQYNVQVAQDGSLDLSRIAMGKSGRNDIKDVIETVSKWGTKPGDNTPLGLDVLKRQLDDFYSDSSQARQFVTAMRNKVKDTIVDNVPAYADMTKGYSEATSMIKDIESGLMMRKQGMSGRVVADQTLRRLISALRDNFPLRNDLVNTLGQEGGQDIAGQLAGHSLSPVLPRGLAGTGPVLAGEAAIAHFITPKMWPVLAASSPRVQGEFLRIFGQAMASAGKLPPEVARALTVQAGAEANARALAGAEPKD